MDACPQAASSMPRCLTSGMRLTALSHDFGTKYGKIRKLRVLKFPVASWFSLFPKIQILRAVVWVYDDLRLIDRKFPSHSTGRAWEAGFNIILDTAVHILISGCSLPHLRVTRFALRSQNAIDTFSHVGLTLPYFKGNDSVLRLESLKILWTPKISYYVEYQREKEFFVGNPTQSRSKATNMDALGDGQGSFHVIVRSTHDTQAMESTIQYHTFQFVVYLHWREVFTAKQWGQHSELWINSSDLKTSTATTCLLTQSYIQCGRENSCYARQTHQQIPAKWNYIQSYIFKA